MIQRRRILLADDELSIRRAYCALLEPHGYIVEAVRNGKEAVESFGRSRPDLVLLDVMMPVMDGLSACAAIRRLDSLAPVLFFTAAPTEETKVMAFGFGADDYISKTQSPEEFVARIGAALRRSDAFARRLERRERHLEGIEFDPARMTVSAGGTVSALSKSEAMLFRMLTESPGRFFTPEEIFSELRGDGYVGDVRAIRTLVSRLKAKLGDFSNRITGARGAGYAYRA